jgi:hypothetical protein
VKEIILTLEASSKKLHDSLHTELERNKIAFEDAMRSKSLKWIICHGRLDWMQQGVLNASRFNAVVLKELM